MTTRQDVIDCAREWLGTRWQHQARVKGVGVDCAGLCIGVGRELDLLPADKDINGYGREPDGTLLQIADTFAIRILNPVPGDVVVIAFNGRPMHFGILATAPDGAETLIHAYAQARKVVEHRLDAQWRARIVAAYRFDGVM